MPDESEVLRSPTLQWLFALSLGITVGIFSFVMAASFIGPSIGASLIAILAGTVVAVFVGRGRILALDRAAVSRGLLVVSALATIGAVVQLGRLAVFMVDSSRVAYSAVPNSDWEVRHSCVSAYYVSAKAVHVATSIYDDSLYTARDDDPSKPREALMLGPFRIDVYEYPPPFLLLPRALEKLTPDFLPFRMLWFGLNGLLILWAIVVVARRLGPAAGTRALLLSPLIWAAPATIGTLQKGNVQILIIAGSIVAMALFERRRWAAGGAILAFATVSKLYPGLLVFYLLARRQWRALAWTAGFAALFAVSTLAMFGWAPYSAFVKHMPRLLSGEAFPAFRRPAATAINYSIPGLVFKLKLFGVPHMGFPASKLVGWVYTLMALGVTFLVARRELRDQVKPVVWMALLIVATLRSPFLPQTYAGIPALWLLTLIAANHAPTRKTLSWLLIGWLALCIGWPTDWPMDPRLLALGTGIPQALTVGLAAMVLWSKLREEASGPSAGLAPG